MNCTRRDFVNSPESGCESRDAAQEGEGDDDEEEGEEDGHVVTGRATFSCYRLSLLTPGPIPKHTAAACKHLRARSTHTHTYD